MVLGGRNIEADEFWEDGYELVDGQWSQAVTLTLGFSQGGAVYIPESEVEKYECSEIID